MMCAAWVFTFADALDSGQTICIGHGAVERAFDAVVLAGRRGAGHGAGINGMQHVSGVHLQRLGTPMARDMKPACCAATLASVVAIVSSPDLSGVSMYPAVR